MMYSGGLNQRQMDQVAELGFTFRLPNVPLLDSVSGEICSSNSVTDARRVANMNVPWMVFDADREVVQVWSGTEKGDRTVETLGGSTGECTYPGH